MKQHKITYFNPTLKLYLELRIRRFIKQLLLWIKSMIKKLLNKE